MAFTFPPFSIIRFFSTDTFGLWSLDNLIVFQFVLYSDIIALESPKFEQNNLLSIINTDDTVLPLFSEFIFEFFNKSSFIIINPSFNVLIEFSF